MQAVVLPTGNISAAILLLKHFPVRRSGGGAGGRERGRENKMTTRRE
jgi:hypothetical protein